MVFSSAARAIRLGQLKWWSERLEKFRREHRLQYLFWETTHICNLHCRHCGSDCGPAAAGELTTEEIKDVFKSIAEDYDAKTIMVAVTGGEPLMRKDLFDVMGYASGLGFGWGMVTNGMLVNEEIAEKCAAAGMRTVTVSVDGLRETHDHIRRFKGSFDRSVRALETFKASGRLRVVQATTCVSDYNLHELDQLYDRFKRNGVDEWRLLTVNPIGRAREDPRFMLKPEQLKQLLDFIVAKRGQKGLSVTFEEEGFLGPDYEGIVRTGLYYCPAGINIGSILADGSIAACPNLPRDYIQGNVRVDRFRDVWEHEYRRMRDLSWKKAGECAACQWWPFCQGNSLHLWDIEAGKPVLCHLRALEEARRRPDNII
ncbi:MAG: pyrroloquinoline quinone biosynthesis protein PqqE [Methanocella sp. PtaU1.Bin125]|nr:MAG: pyrroloquinoline quinone biosynthesis protein PqqE [Methanocella sp. PtaU1.Bin125]